MIGGATVLLARIGRERLELARDGWQRFLDALDDARHGRQRPKHHGVTEAQRRIAAHRYAERVVGHPLTRKSARRVMRKLNKARGLPTVAQAKKKPLPPVPAPPSFYRSPTSSR
jgi:hypothetical protein